MPRPCAVPYPNIRTALKITIPENISNLYISIAGIILILIGAFISFRKPSEQVKEIPIYEGHDKKRKLVGIQRVNR